MPTSFSDSVDVMGFEGAEKKMEIIFSNVSKDHDTKLGLRSYGLEHWSAVVATLNGSILKNDSLEEFDSYLISESSLFVYADRVVILTCGTTTLLKSLPSILESARKIDMDVTWFQFSRKNFLYPDEQLFPHKSFDQEIKYCSEMFSDGHAHILGPLNGDHWCVFVVDRMQQDSCDMKDQTLNLYMYGINQDIAQLFMKSEQMILPSLFDSKEKTLASGENQLEITKEAGCNTKLLAPCFTFVTSAAEATSRSGINLLMEDDDGKVVHDHLFDPCGYSMNGVARKDRYWTIHITPEAHCSYVSFETNFAPESYDSLVSKVMRTFKPQRATVVIQADKMSPLLSGASSLNLAAGTVDGFSVTGQSITQLVDEYTVQLVNYEAVDSSTDDGTWTMSSQSSIDSDRS